MGRLVRRVVALMVFMVLVPFVGFVEVAFWVVLGKYGYVFDWLMSFVALIAPEWED